MSVFGTSRLTVLPLMQIIDGHMTVLVQVIVACSCVISSRFHPPPLICLEAAVLCIVRIGPIVKPVSDNLKKKVFC